MIADPFSAPIEADCRRPDFVGGIPARMIDGTEWFLAEPRVRFVPSENEVGFQLTLSLDDDCTFDRLATRYQELTTLPEDEFQAHAMDHAGVEARLGAMMLLRNYMLDPRDLRRLLQLSHDPADAAAYELRRAIVAALAGDVPKRLAGGEGPSPTLPA